MTTSNKIPTKIITTGPNDHELRFKYGWSMFKVGREAEMAVRAVYGGDLPDPMIYEAACMLADFKADEGRRYTVKLTIGADGKPVDHKPTITPDEYFCQWERIFSQIGELEAAMLNDNPNSETGQNTAVKRFIDQKRATVQLMTQSLNGQTIRTPEGLAVPDGTHYKIGAHPLKIKRLAVRLIELSKEHGTRNHFVKLARLLEALGYYSEDEERDKGHYDWTARLRNLVEDWRKQLADYKPTGK